MKYVVFLGDGMADVPVPELGGKTPLDSLITHFFDCFTGQITGKFPCANQTRQEEEKILSSLPLRA